MPIVARIRAIAEYLPPEALDNAALALEHPEWDVAKVASKTGILSRRVAGPGETAGDLGARAAQALFARAGVTPDRFDYLIFCTQSPDYFLPTTACVLQHRLGLPVTAGAFDFNQGCSGYVYGLQLARALILAEEARNVLVVTGETYSRYIHPDDRTVRLLFGDAASATWVSAEGEGAAIGPVVVGTDGSGARNLIVPAGAARAPSTTDPADLTTDAFGNRRSSSNLFMDGREVFNFTLERVPPLIDTVLGRAGVARDEVQWWVLHQANRFMNEHLRKKLGLPAERVPERLSEIGNTVSATIPLVLNNAARGFRDGDKVMIVGFGVGYSWGAAMLEWSSAVMTGDRA